MKFEWDENKRLSNLRKHKIDFLDAEEIFHDYTITIEDKRDSYGEQRFVTFGKLKNFTVQSFIRKQLKFYG